MIYTVCLCWLGLVGVATAGDMDDMELDVFYADCSKYESDLFGGPVCGSDGTTYRNQIHLSCLNHKHKKSRDHDIGISSHGSCPGDVENTACPWDPMYKPVCGSDGKTYCNKEWLICKNNKSSEEVVVSRSGECHQINPCTTDHKVGPRVCASNGLTYNSAEVVRCLRTHHADLEINHEGGCSVEEVRKLYPNRRRVCEISKHHHEYNPVCSKNTTYGNPYIYLCTNPLGGSVLSGGSCDSRVQTACRRAVKLDREHEECRKHSHLNQVCGNDGLTYRSIDHLHCAAKNNSQLRKLHEGTCTWRDSPCLRCKELEGTVPVCGSDGITYSSFVALACVTRSRDPSLRFVHIGVCISKKGSRCYGSDCY